MALASDKASYFLSQLLQKPPFIGAFRVVHVFRSRTTSMLDSVVALNLHQLQETNCEIYISIEDQLSKGIAPFSSWLVL